MTEAGIEAMLQGVVDRIGSGGKFKVYQGATLLGAVLLASPAGAIADGVLTFAPASAGDDLAVATGVPDFGALEASDGSVLDTFTAGGPGSGAQIIVTIVDPPAGDPPGKMYAGGKFYLDVVTLGE